MHSVAWKETQSVRGPGILELGVLSAERRIPCIQQQSSITVYVLGGYSELTYLFSDDRCSRL
jgi:hypothetical protein